MPIKPRAVLLFFVFQGRDGSVGAETLRAGNANVFRKPLYYMYIRESAKIAVGALSPRSLSPGSFIV